MATSKQRDTKEGDSDREQLARHGQTPSSMIMAVTQGCGGGRFGRTKRNSGAFAGADALRVGAGRPGDGAAWADSALARTPVGHAGLAERLADDG